MLCSASNLTSTLTFFPQIGERSWSERNGGDSGDWNGSTSPRKEFSTQKDFSGGGRSGIDNWRRHRGGGEDEEGSCNADSLTETWTRLWFLWFYFLLSIPGWRKSEKWGRSNSWRDEGDGGEGGLSKSSSRTSSWGRGWADEGLRGRSYEDESSSGRRGFMDEVPEWAMENPSESGGTFDASGAFHGGSYSDEDEVGLLLCLVCFHLDYLITRKIIYRRTSPLATLGIVCCPRNWTRGTSLSLLRP